MCVGGGGGDGGGGMGRARVESEVSSLVRMFNKES